MTTLRRREGTRRNVNDLLNGTRVLELSENVAPAYAGKLFAWLGADVRVYRPPVRHAGGQAAEELVSSWLHDGKRTLTFAEAESACDEVDVVIIDEDALAPALQGICATARASLDARADGPVVVSVASVRDGGDTTPGNALTAAAWSGLSWSMGSPDKPPLSLPYDLPSFQGGSHAVAAVLTRLLAGSSCDGMRRIDVSTRDVLAYYTGMITANFIPYEREWRRDGARPPGSGGVYPASIFPCVDGHVTFMCRSQREWTTLIEAMGNPEWSRDPRFADPRVIARLHADEVDQYLVPWIASHTRDEMLEFGRSNGLPIAPVRSFDEVLAEPHFDYRDYFEPHPKRSDVQVPGRPWKLHDSGHQAEPTKSLEVGAGAAAPTGLLAGLKVLDLSWVWSGPMVTSMLVDLGANVIKVEHEGHMDAGRVRGRARRNGVEVPGPEHEVTPYFNQMSHGKRSITLDVKTVEGRRVLQALAAEADVIVENMRPGALARAGLLYHEVAATNPGIVLLSMSMAGQAGPLSAMKGYAGIMAALSGLDSVIGYDEHDLIGSLTPALGDPNGASHAITVLLAALLRRQRTGVGAWIDLSQIEALLSVTPAPLIRSQVAIGEPSVPANTHPRQLPHGHFECSEPDSWAAIAVANQAQWSGLADLAREDGFEVGEPDWASNLASSARRTRVETTVAEWARTQRRDALVKRLIDAGVPAAPVNDYDGLSTASWLVDRQMTTDVQHTYLGETRIFVVPWKFAGMAAGVAKPAPLLGEHTDEVLKEVLSMTESEIDQLRQTGALR